MVGEGEDQSSSLEKISDYTWNRQQQIFTFICRKMSECVIVTYFKYTNYHQGLLE